MRLANRINWKSAHQQNAFLYAFRNNHILVEHANGKRLFSYSQKMAHTGKHVQSLDKTQVAIITDIKAVDIRCLQDCQVRQLGYDGVKSLLLEWCNHHFEWGRMGMMYNALLDDEGALNEVPSFLFESPYPERFQAYFIEYEVLNDVRITSE